MRFLFMFTAFVLLTAHNSFADDKADTKKLSASAQEKIATIKKLDGRISELDAEMITLQDALAKEQTELESLEFDEGQAREKLQKELANLGLLARNMARVERLPLEAMSFFEGNLRESHQRLGIIAQGRKSLAKRISQQRGEVYELQQIRTNKMAHADSIAEKQLQLAEHREKLQDLFNKQVGMLRLDSKEQADLLANARKAAKKAENLQQLTDMARHASIPEKPEIVHRHYEGLPVRGSVVRGYGESNNVGVHAQGITVETTTEEPVLSLSDGRVIYSDSFRDYGHIIIVEHEDGVNTLYSGMSNSTLKVGDYARAGQTLGLMPKESSPELYLEVRRSGQTINPVSWIQKNKGS